MAPKWIVLLLFWAGLEGVCTVKFRPPVHTPALFVTSRNVKGQYELLKLNGTPPEYVRRYRAGATLNFTSIIGSDGNTGFKALSYHHDRAMVVWSNPLQADIEWIPNFNTGDAPISDVHLAASDQVNGLAIDWLSHNVYWTDSKHKVIAMATIEDPYLSQAHSPYSRVLVTDGLEEPWGLAVDPYRGRLFWTDAALGVIEVADLTGHRLELIELTAPEVRPTSLALSVHTDELFFVDETHRGLWRVNLTDHSQVNFFHVRDDAHVVLRGVTLWKDWLLTTGSSSNINGSIIYVMQHTAVGNSIRMHLKNGLEIVDLFDLDVFDDDQQPPLDVKESPVCGTWKEKTCPHICVGYQRISKNQCLCADGYVDDRPCEDSPAVVVPTVSDATMKPEMSSTTTGSLGPNIGGTDLIIAVSVCVGGLLLIVLLISAVVCYIRRSKKRVPQETNTTPVVHANPAFAVSEEPPPYTADNYLVASAGPVSDADIAAIAAMEEKKEKS